ncbi:MAG: hypothetical protein L6R41_006640 [Letrouitia leprolyta]|nr:MAG: hypothetical protein L6R41_006640 [Letrouitia leprolyta]
MPLTFHGKLIIFTVKGWDTTVPMRNGPASPPILWTTVELSVGVLAGSLPALAPLLKKIPGPRTVAAYIYTRSRRKESVQLHEV